MSILGIVLDPRDLEMYAREREAQTETPPTQTKKKARLMQRLMSRAPEVFQKALWKAADNAEYERKRASKTIYVTLPQKSKPLTHPVEEETPPPRDVPVSPPPRDVPVSPPPVSKAPSPPPRLSSPPPRLSSPPPVVPSEPVPRESVESPEVEMYFSPPKVRIEAPLPEVPSPLVIPASPIEGGDAMEESPFNPKRSITLPPPQPLQQPRPTSPPMPVPAVNPAPIVQPQPVAAPQFPAFAARPEGQPPQQPVPGRRRVLRASRSRRQEDTTNVAPTPMDASGMQTTPAPPTFFRPSISGSSFAGSVSSFSNPSSPGSFFAAPTPTPSFGAPTPTPSFGAPTPTPSFGAPTPTPSFSGAANPFQSTSSSHTFNSQPIRADTDQPMDQAMDEGLQSGHGFGGALPQTAPFGGSPSQGAPFGGSPSGGMQFGETPSQGAPFGGSISQGAPFGGSPSGGMQFGVGQMPGFQAQQPAMPQQASPPMMPQGGAPSFAMGVQTTPTPRGRARGRRKPRTTN